MLAFLLIRLTHCARRAGRWLIFCLLWPGIAAADQVRISNLSDVNTPIWIPGDPDIVTDIFVCIYRENSNRNSAVARYRITALGDGPGMFLTSGFRKIPYTVVWDDGGAGNPSGGSSRPLLYAVPVLNLDHARTQRDIPANSSDCAGGSAPTARARITIRAADLDAAMDGTYNGTLTLIVVPI